MKRGKPEETGVLKNMMVNDFIYSTVTGEHLPKMKETLQKYNLSTKNIQNEASSSSQPQPPPPQNEASSSSSQPPQPAQAQEAQEANQGLPQNPLARLEALRRRNENRQNDQ